MWGHAPEIIAQAGQSPLYLIAFALLASLGVAWMFFRTSSNWVKVPTYFGLLTLLGTAIVAVSVVAIVPMIATPQGRPPALSQAAYPPFVAPVPLPVDRAPFDRAPSSLVSSVNMQRLVGVYVGSARNSIQGNVGTMTLSIVAVTPSGSAQVHLAESNGLQGTCFLSGGIAPNSELRAVGACQDSAGWYDAEIQARVLDRNTINGMLGLLPRRGTMSLPQQEQFEVRR